MTRFDIEQILTYYLSTYAENEGLDVCYPNKVFEPVIGENWLGVSFMQADSSDTVIAEGYERLNGIMQININVPKNTGTYDLYKISDDLKSIFKSNGILSYNGSTVHLQHTYLRGEDISDNWFCKFLTIEYSEFNL